MENEKLIKAIFLAWEKRDWDFVRSALAEGFAFTSLYDDHLDMREYKQRCWDSVKEM